MYKRFVGCKDRQKSHILQIFQQFFYWVLHLLTYKRPYILNRCCREAARKVVAKCHIRDY